MTSRKNSSGSEPRTVANCAVVRVARGISTTDDLEEWVVQAGSIRAGLQMDSCCILPAMTASNEIDEMPLDWGGWWIRRVSLSRSRCDCSTAGGSSRVMVSCFPGPEW